MNKNFSNDQANSRIPKELKKIKTLQNKGLDQNKNHGQSVNNVAYILMEVQGQG